MRIPPEWLRPKSRDCDTLVPRLDEKAVKTYWRKVSHLPAALSPDRFTADDAEMAVTARKSVVGACGNFARRYRRHGIHRHSDLAEA
jgi:hypothetical protein